eukprot:2006346-Pyramimonas_sp.AAC.1
MRPSWPRMPPKKGPKRPRPLIFLYAFERFARFILFGLPTAAVAPKIAKRPQSAPRGHSETPKTASDGARP